jgi:hypothetical protein
MENIIEIVSQVDPSTMDHVNNMIQDGYNEGELNISLPNDEELHGWWSIQNGNLNFHIENDKELLEN